MKKYILLSIILLFCQLIKAQDTIVKSNGEKISAKITEITSSEVKYKKFDFQDGPLYILNKSEILLIKYSNGLKEEFQVQQPKESSPPIQSGNDYYGAPQVPASNKIEVWGYRYRYKDSYMNEKQLHNMLLQTKDKQIISLVGNSKDAKTLQFIGFLGIPLGIAAVGFFWKSVLLNTNSTLDQGSLTASGICLVGAIACPIASAVFKHNRTMYNRQAIKIYNEKY